MAFFFVSRMAWSMRPWREQALPAKCLFTLCLVVKQVRSGSGKLPVGVAEPLDEIVGEEGSQGLGVSLAWQKLFRATVNDAGIAGHADLSCEQRKSAGIGDPHIFFVDGGSGQLVAIRWCAS
jgi:hypothetical protein